MDHALINERGNPDRNQKRQSPAPIHLGSFVPREHVETNVTDAADDDLLASNGEQRVPSADELQLERHRQLRNSHRETGFTGKGSKRPFVIHMDDDSDFKFHLAIPSRSTRKVPKRCVDCGASRCLRHSC